MITIITGENTFENERALKRVISAFDGEAERFDGEILEVKQLPDILMGVSLFASKRLVIIKNLSSNKALWNAFEDRIGRISDDTHLVLVDEKPDKRTKTYKLLQKQADIHESKLWTERDTLKAEQWVEKEVAAHGKNLDKKSVRALVVRVGVDQWLLWQALQKLVVLDEITPEVIEEVIEPSGTENAFHLFEAALKGDEQKVLKLLKGLEKTEDPYRLFGLLSGQAFQLTALGAAEVSDATVAADFGVHPFALSKLSPYAKRLGKEGVKTVLGYFAQADTAMKTSAGDPWLLIERALIKTAKTTQ